MLRFFFSPGACSVGIRVLLEEARASYASTEINVMRGVQNGEAYRAVNPKGKVPAILRDDGSLLTEYQAIAWWIARSYPAAGLAPYDQEGQIRAMELLDYIVGTVHMRGFSLLIVPHRFARSEGAQTEIREYGRQVAAAGMDQLSAALGEKDWLAGRFSLADSGLFYLTFWARRHAVPLAPNLKAFHERMKARPSVTRALAGEGLDASA